tara:strand:+ start:23 stop:370 length:348 start_codon:yes stop_codon:yes gene_type:complete
VNICIATNDSWVRESLEKNLIGDYVLSNISSEIIELSENLMNLDYFFIDMQFSNAGGPATIKMLKALFSKENIREPYFVLIADRDIDVFQGKRVGVNEVIIKPITNSKIKNILTK